MRVRENSWLVMVMRQSWFGWDGGIRNDFSMSVQEEGSGSMPITMLPSALYAYHQPPLWPAIML